MLKTNHLFASKGKSKATYYIAGVRLSTEAADVNTEVVNVSTEANGLNTEGTTLGPEIETDTSESVDYLSTEATSIDRELLLEELP